MYAAFRLLEKGFLVLALLGVVMRSAFVEGGMPVMLVGLLALALLYFVGGYFQARPLEPAKPTALAPQKLAGLRIFSGIALSMILIGILFRLLFWQGSTIEILVGLVLGAIAQLWAYVAGRSSGQPVATSVFRRLALLMAIGGLMLLTPVSTLISWFHRDDSALASKLILSHQHLNDPAALQAVREHLEAKQKQL